MGWKDAPIVEDGPAWARAPIVEDAPPEPKRGFGDYALPAVAEFNRQNPNAGFSLGRYGALAKDALSAPRRLTGALVRGVQGDTEGAKQELLKTKGDGVVESITREAPAFFLPSVAAARGANLVQRVGNTMIAGAAEAAPMAVTHQLQRLSEGEDLSAGQFAGELAAGAGLRGVAQAGAEGARKLSGFVKRGVSSLTEVPQEALQDATNPAKLAGFKDAAQRFASGDGTMDVSGLSKDLASKVQAKNAANQAAFETAEAAQRAEMEGALRPVLGKPPETGVSEITDDLLGKVQAKNAADQAAFEAAQASQKAKMEGELITLRGQNGGTRLSGIDPSQGGEILRGRIDNSKSPLQLRFVKNDQAALGNLKGAPVATQTFSPIAGKTETVKTVVPDLADVLTEFKALDPSQGVPKITSNAASAIRKIMVMADKQANTIDDLINLKSQLRSMWDSGGFEGGLFDKTVDDVAFAKGVKAIEDAEDASIRAALGASRPARNAAEEATVKTAMKQSDEVIKLLNANRQLYAVTKEALSKLDRRFGQIENSNRLISRIKEMGPDAADLINMAQNNEVLKPVVEDLRRGFIDDLLLSGVKQGDFSPKEFAKAWLDLPDNIKKTWLTPAQVASVNKAVKAGLEPITEPEKVGKALFGSDFDKFLARERLENIEDATKAKAMAELKTLDALFGSDFSKKAISAYRTKKLNELLLSGVKMGEFNPKAFQKAWLDLPDNTKKTWLNNEQIEAVNKVVARGVEPIAKPKVLGKELFGVGDNFDFRNSHEDLRNIGNLPKEKALAELRELDEIFNSNFADDAFNAYRAGQLKMNKEGKLGPFSTIRTGKSTAMALAGATTAGSVGHLVAGPMGGYALAPFGYLGGLYAQSPAGALWAFRALNKLEKPSFTLPSTVRAAARATQTAINEDEDQ